MLSPEGMEKLRELLPPDQLIELESLLENGNSLPLPADVADPGTAAAHSPLLQWMLQLAEGEAGGEEIAARLGTQSAPGSTLTVADLRNILLRQGSGTGPEAVTTGQEKNSFRAADAQTALLLAKGEISADAAGVKTGLFTGEASAGVLNNTGTLSMPPLATVVSGLEQLSSQRTGVYTPPAITLPTGEKGWDSMLGNRVVWMVGNQLQQASLQITPRHLGPIDIQVSIQNDQASVSFLASNAAVKEAIEAAIPRLREMFADNNVQLTGVDVGQRDAGAQGGGAAPFQQADAGAGSNPAAAGPWSGETDAAVENPGTVKVMVSNGLVDDYA